jgi:transposase-like protein
MQFQLNAAGKRIYPSEFKRKVLDELRGGATTHELGRRYGVPIQNIVNWRRAEQVAVLGKAHEAKAGESVPLSEYKKALEEIKNLRRSLVNATLDRDILKEAHDIAVKKKWILPGK